MKYRILGKTGLTVSVVGMGTWQFGGEWGKDFDQGEVDAMFDQARETGVNLIDTAECYGDHTSERLIGKAIERDQDKWIIATKFGHKFNGPFDRSEPRTAEDVREQIHASLKALRTDVIDLYQYHSWGDDEFFNDDVAAALEQLKQAGKIRHIGNSIAKNGNVRQVAASAGLDIEAIQIIYNRLDRTPEETTFPVCREQRLGVLARVPLASGYLSGKYEVGHRFGSNEMRGRWHTPEHTDQTLERVAAIQRDEVPPGIDMAQWALAWVLQHPAVTCVIPGCKNAAQVASNAAAAGLDLVRDDHPQAM